MKILIPSDLKYFRFTVYLPKVFIHMYTHPVTPRPNKTAARTDFHSPVGAFISAYVWQKLARYTEMTKFG